MTRPPYTFYNHFNFETKIKLFTLYLYEGEVTEITITSIYISNNTSIISVTVFLKEQFGLKVSI